MDGILYRQMVETAANAGIDIIGTERAAQILAVVYLYGDESSVYSTKMKTDIAHICRKYGIHGTGEPDAGMIGKIKKYTREIKDSGKPEWLSMMEVNYGVSFPEYREPPKPERR